MFVCVCAYIYIKENEEEGNRDNEEGEVEGKYSSSFFALSKEREERSIERHCPSTGSIEVGRFRRMNWFDADISKRKAEATPCPTLVGHLCPERNRNRLTQTMYTIASDHRWDIIFLFHSLKCHLFLRQRNIFALKSGSRCFGRSQLAVHIQ